jgi:hypothetical protein
VRAQLLAALAGSQRLTVVALIVLPICALLALYLVLTSAYAFSVDSGPLRIELKPASPPLP